MSLFSIFKKPSTPQYLKLQFYVVEDNGNGFILDAHGLPLYGNSERPTIGLPWIGTEAMLPAQIEFVAERYEINYGKKPRKIIPQDYEGRIY